ncbi:hypothetical protein [uncultured Nisaea sp.]|uniref:hypothetical protein n=1 Tax=uncultured Nisaea sp. TaxID=538215 RepID=UPI0030EC1959|tara:strand:+ start:172 stop:351 length:180 start_codon:yes stop_codon:yes gene_type:complete
MVKSQKTASSCNQKTEADLRAERRAAALRANLHRRKAQARQRIDDAGDSSPDTKKDDRD